MIASTRFSRAKALAVCSAIALFSGSFPVKNAVAQSGVPAASDASPTETLPERTPLVSPEIPAVETANYSDEQMSIDYPATWQVEIGEEGMVSIQSASDMSEAVTQPIITQVFRVAAPPGPLVDANIDSFVEEGAAIRRYSGAKIDGQDALVIWLADRPEVLSRAIATFIGYGDETIFLFTQYNSEEVESEANILRLHTSFSNLAFAEAAEDSE